MRLYFILLVLALLAQGCKEDEKQPAVCECKSEQSVIYGYDTSFVPPGDTIEIQITQVTALDIREGYAVKFKLPGQWQNPVWTPATWLSCTNCLEPVATPDSFIVYTVTATAQSGTTHSFSIGIAVVFDTTTPPPNVFYIPNIFTPNGDGWNDIFYVSASNPGALHLIVKDGSTTVFEAHDFYHWWGGTINGNIIEEGCVNYAYTADITFRNRQAVRVTGEVTLYMNHSGTICPNNAIDCRFGSQFDGTGFNPNLESEIDHCL